MTLIRSLAFFAITLLAAWRAASSQNCVVDGKLSITPSSQRNITLLPFVDFRTTLDTPGFSIINPPGPCENDPGRGEQPFRLTPIGSALPPFSTEADRDVDFSTEPYCIAFTGNLFDTTNVNNIGAIFNIMEQPIVGPTIGSLELGAQAMVFTLGDATATFNNVNAGNTFPLAINPYVHLQICVSNGVATFYESCNSVASVEFNSDTTIGQATLTFFQNSTTDSSNRFGVCDFLCVCNLTF